MTQPTVNIPPGSQPQPIPMSFAVSGVEGPAGKFVRCDLFCALGNIVLHFDLDGALQFSGLIRSTAKQARLGLELPPGVVMPDSDNGDGS